MRTHKPHQGDSPGSQWLDTWLDHSQNYYMDESKRDYAQQFLKFNLHLNCLNEKCW